MIATLASWRSRVQIPARPPNINQVTNCPFFEPTCLFIVFSYFLSTVVREGNFFANKKPKSPKICEAKSVHLCPSLEVTKVCILSEFKLTVLFVIGIVFLEKVISMKQTHHQSPKINNMLFNDRNSCISHVSLR
jgi:hypothetical protein